MLDKERLKTDLLALGLLALVVFVGLSFLSYDPADPPSTLVFPLRQVPTNICGEVGAAVAFHTRQWLGFGVWVMLMTLISWDLKLFSREPSRRSVPTLIGIVLLVISCCALLHLFASGISSGSTFGSGGRIGAWSGVLLQQKLSSVGVVIFAGSLFAAGILLTPLSDVLQPALRLAAIPASAVRGTVEILRRRQELTVRRPRNSAKDTKAVDETSATIPFVIPEAPETEISALSADVAARSIRINPPVALGLHNPDGLAVAERRGFSLPDISLLKESEEFPYEQLAKKARVAATTLEKAFEEFGLNVKVAEIDTGPVVTQF
jgi:S-DNA-T family DNA segregation ATPase FtsK/SpoIIIE